MTAKPNLSREFGDILEMVIQALLKNEEPERSQVTFLRAEVDREYPHTYDNPFVQQIRLVNTYQTLLEEGGLLPDQEWKPLSGRKLQKMWNEEMEK